MDRCKLAKASKGDVSMYSTPLFLEAPLRFLIVKIGHLIESRRYKFVTFLFHLTCLIISLTGVALGLLWNFAATHVTMLPFLTTWWFAGIMFLMWWIIEVLVYRTLSGDYDYSIVHFSDLVQSAICALIIGSFLRAWALLM